MKDIEFIIDLIISSLNKDKDILESINMIVSHYNNSKKDILRTIIELDKDIGVVEQTLLNFSSKVAEKKDEYKPKVVHILTIDKDNNNDIILHIISSNIHKNKTNTTVTIKKGLFSYKVKNTAIVYNIPYTQITDIFYANYNFKLLSLENDNIEEINTTH